MNITEVEDSAQDELDGICKKMGASIDMLLLYIECDYSNVYLSRGMKIHVKNLLWLSGKL